MALTDFKSAIDLIQWLSSLSEKEMKILTTDNDARCAIRNMVQEFADDVFSVDPLQRDPLKLSDVCEAIAILVDQPLHKPSKNEMCLSDSAVGRDCLDILYGALFESEKNQILNNEEYVALIAQSPSEPEEYTRWMKKNIESNSVVNGIIFNHPFYKQYLENDVPDCADEQYARDVLRFFLANESCLDGPFADVVESMAVGAPGLESISLLLNALDEKGFVDNRDFREIIKDCVKFDSQHAWAFFFIKGSCCFVSSHSFCSRWGW